MENSIDFLIHFCQVVWQFRIIMASLLVLIFLGGIIFAMAETIPLASGIYFALQTALTLGFGDITGKTRVGRVMSLVIGVLGLILFGLIVAKATYALQYTIGLSKPL